MPRMWAPASRRLAPPVTRKASGRDSGLARWPASGACRALHACCTRPVGGDARRCQASEFSERGQLFMTPLIQAMRTIVHLGETVPEAEQARPPRRQGSQSAGLVPPLPGAADCRPDSPAARSPRKSPRVWLLMGPERLTAV